jgi:hypothetical protein
MKKSKEYDNLQNDIINEMANIEKILILYKKKIKAEYTNILIDEKNKLLVKIAIGENLDLRTLKSKYLKNKELLDNDDIKLGDSEENEELLDSCEINGNKYYYENKDNGKVYDESNKMVANYVNSKIIFL